MNFKKTFYKNYLNKDLILKTTLLFLILFSTQIVQSQTISEGAVEITEIVYSPQKGPGWIEILNTSDASIDVTSLKIKVDDLTSIAITEYQSGGTSLSAGEVAVITIDSTAIASYTGNRFVSAFSFSTSESDPKISIVDSSDVSLYSVTYESSEKVEATGLSYHVVSQNEIVIAPETMGELITNPISSEYARVADVPSAATSVVGGTAEGDFLLLSEGDEVSVHILQNEVFRENVVVKILIGDVEIKEETIVPDLATFPKVTHTIVAGDLVNVGDVNYKVLKNNSEILTGIVFHEGDKVAVDKSDLEITEINYNPGNGAKYEWIEIINRGTANVDLTDFIISDEGTERVIAYIEGDQTISANEIALVARVGISTDLERDLDDLKESITTYSGPIFRSQFSLRNTGEDTIKIVSPYGRELDSVTYNNSMGASGNQKTLHVSADGAIFEADQTPGVDTTDPPEGAPISDPQDPQTPAEDEDEEEVVTGYEDKLPKVKLYSFDGTNAASGQNIFFTKKDTVNFKIRIEDNATDYSASNIDSHLTLTFDNGNNNNFSQTEVSKTETAVSSGIVEIEYKVNFASNAAAQDGSVTFKFDVTDDDTTANHSSKKSIIMVKRDTSAITLEKATTASTLGFSRENASNVIVPIKVSNLSFGEWAMISYAGSCGDGLLKFVVRNGDYGVKYDLTGNEYADCTVSATDSADNATTPLSLQTITIAAESE